MSTRPPIKIALFHIMAGGFSGAAKTIFRLLRLLDLEKVEPVLVGQVENELTRRTADLGLKVEIVPFPPGLAVYGGQLLRFNLFGLIKTLIGVWQYNLSLIRFFKTLKPQVVWADNIRTFMSLYIASKFSGCKIIWNIWSEPKGKVVWVAHRVGLILADAVNLEYQAQGAKLFGRLASPKWFGRKIITLYTGVTDFEHPTGTNVRAELNLSPSDCMIFMGANITPAKGQLDLLYAMERLVNQFPHTHLVLAGQPLETHPASVAYDATLKSFVREKRLSSHVHFLGWRSDFPDLLEATDIYVSTSYSESFPDSVREAVQVGKAVVVTNVGGTFEMVDVGDTGYLFEPGDVPTLVTHLSQLLQDRALRERMGELGKRRIATKWSTELYARNFENMVSSLFPVEEGASIQQSRTNRSLS